MDPINPFDIYSSMDMAQYPSLLSPSLSPSDAAKSNALSLNNRPVKSGLLLPAQSMGGPSYDYESYQQHTGLVTGSIASTYAINQSLHGGGGMDFDFNSPIAPTTASPFASPLTATMDAANISPVRQTIDPSSLQSETAPQPSSSTSTTNMRVYNGFHTHQAAAAAEAAKSKIKLEAQQMQQQQIIQQQQQQRLAAQQQAAAAKPQRPRVQSSPSDDPLLDAKISQVLNRIRQQESSADRDLHSPESPDDGRLSHSKDLSDMDEDERLLNSEEGKKMTPKERRQLRNKVSARAFRKRRKEMINDLESVNSGLTRQVDKLTRENQKLLSDNENMRKLVQHLLETPNFASYLQEQILAPNAQQTPVAASPLSAQPRQRSQPFHNLPAIPEQTQTQTLQMADVLAEDLFTEDAMTDFNSMPVLSTQNSNEFDMFTDTTQIFAVMDTPQPSIDISALSGKTSNFVGQQEDLASNDEKVEIPAREKCPAHITAAPPVAVEKVEKTSTTADEDFDNDPAFALWHETAGETECAVSSAAEPVEFDTDGLSHVDIFGGIELEKVFERYELVDASEEEVGAALAMERVERISASLEGVVARLELMTIDL